MFTINIDGLDELKRTLTDMGKKQLPFASATAITLTAKMVENRIQFDMSSAFKSASPYVKRATFSTSANKTNLTATIGLKDQKPSGGTAPAVLLKEHFIGGLRGNKPFEKAIISMGVMPATYRAIPGKGLKLDGYGNPSRNEIREMIGSLRTKMQVFKKHGKKMNLIGYFIIPVGAKSHLFPGIYKRITRGVIKELFLFVPHANYNKIISLERLANEVVSQEFNPIFSKAFSDAMRTAR